MKVIILAGGKGTRLLPLTETIPKTLVKVSGKPILEHILNSLPDRITETIIVVDYLKEEIKKYVQENFSSLHITCVDQQSMRGTFGALVSAKHLIEKNETFLVINGDDIHDKKELEMHFDYPRTFGLQKMFMTNYYNVLRDTDDYVTGFRLQTPEEKKDGTCIATGAYVLNEHIFDHPGAELRDGEYGLPQTILAQKDMYPAKAIYGAKWLPINSLEDLEHAEKVLNER